MRRRSVILVGLGLGAQELTLEGGESLQALHVPNLTEALDAIGRSAPYLVVADSALAPAESFLTAVRHRFPSFRSSVIIVGLSPADPWMTLYGWNVGLGNYEPKPSVSLHLKKEIERLSHAEPSLFQPLTPTQEMPLEPAGAKAPLSGVEPPMPVERPALRLEPLTAVFQSPPDPTAINIDIESPAPEVDIESTVPEADIKPPAPEVDAAPLATSARAPATVPAIPRFKSVRDIGFYNCLELEGRSYHVQTEIIPGTTPKIQTNVVQGGAVLKSELQSLGENPDVVESTKRANAQHEQAVEAVRRGELNS